MFAVAPEGCGVTGLLPMGRWVSGQTEQNNVRLKFEHYQTDVIRILQPQYGSVAVKLK